MTFRCFDCNLPIEGDPCWYDPSAVGVNLNLQIAELTGIVSQRRSTRASIRAISQSGLERQMGRSVDW
jgi:hypothetical protein